MLFSVFVPAVPSDRKDSVSVGRQPHPYSGCSVPPMEVNSNSSTSSLYNFIQVSYLWFLRVSHIVGFQKILEGAPTSYIWGCMFLSFCWPSGIHSYSPKYLIMSTLPSQFPLPPMSLPPSVPPFFSLLRLRYPQFVNLEFCGLCSGYSVLLFFF